MDILEQVLHDPFSLVILLVACAIGAYFARRTYRIHMTCINSLIDGKVAQIRDTGTPIPLEDVINDTANKEVPTAIWYTLLTFIGVSVMSFIILYFIYAIIFGDFGPIA